MSEEVKEGVFMFLDLIVKVSPETNRIMELPIDSADIDEDNQTLIVKVSEWHGAAMLAPVPLSEVVTAITYPKKMSYKVAEETEVEPRNVLVGDDK